MKDSVIFKVPEKEKELVAEFYEPFGDFKMAELTEIMRQKGDRACAEMYNRVREGLQTEEDLKKLMGRNVSKEELMKCIGEPKTVYLSYTNKAVNAANDVWIKNQTNPVVEFKCKDTFTNYQTSAQIKLAKIKVMQKDEKYGPSQTGGAPHRLTLAVGQPIDCSVNVDVSDGLVNGVPGLIKFIDKRLNTVWVLFEEESIGRIRRTSINWVTRQQQLYHCDLSLEEKQALTPIHYHQSRFNVSGDKNGVGE